MGQKLSTLCSKSSGPGDSEHGRWKKLQPLDGAEDLSGPSGTISQQPPHSPAVSSVSMLANYDDEEQDLEVSDDSSSGWETVQLEDNEDKGEKECFKYSSIKSQSGKKSIKKRKRNGKGPTVGEQTTPQIQQCDISNLAGNGVAKSGTQLRPGDLPAAITNSKPLKDADRLLGVLTSHAHDAEIIADGPESGDSVRRIIQHDIGRERSVNTRLRELKDIDGRKSERRLSVTAAASMSLHVIPEMIGEEPAEPEEFQYSDMNVYF